MQLDVKPWAVFCNRDFAFHCLKYKNKCQGHLINDISAFSDCNSDVTCVMVFHPLNIARMHMLCLHLADDCKQIIFTLGNKCLKDATRGLDLRNWEENWPASPYGGLMCLHLTSDPFKGCVRGLAALLLLPSPHLVFLTKQGLEPRGITDPSPAPHPVCPVNVNRKLLDSMGVIPFNNCHVTAYYLHTSIFNGACPPLQSIGFFLLLWRACFSYIHNF